MYVCQSTALVWSKCPTVTIVLPLYPTYYLLLYYFFQLAIDASQLGLCRMEMVDFLYQRRQSRRSILDDRKWERAFNE